MLKLKQKAQLIRAYKKVSVQQESLMASFSEAFKVAKRKEILKRILIQNEIEPKDLA